MCPLLDIRYYVNEPSRGDQLCEGEFLDPQAHFPIHLAHADRPNYFENAEMSADANTR